MPASIKDAIMQRQVLHADAKSFYESTLWRKEKEICLSRMGRNNKERGKVRRISYHYYIYIIQSLLYYFIYNKFYLRQQIPSTLQRPINNNLSTIGEDKAAPFSVRLNETHINNDTYTIEAVAKGKIKRVQIQMLVLVVFINRMLHWINTQYLIFFLLHVKQLS